MTTCELIVKLHLCNLLWICFAICRTTNPQQIACCNLLCNKSQQILLLHSLLHNKLQRAICYAANPQQICNKPHITARMYHHKHNDVMILSHQHPVNCCCPLKPIGILTDTDFQMLTLLFSFCLIFQSSFYRIICVIV